MAINDKIVRINDDGSCGVTQLKGYPTVTSDIITPTLDPATGVINYEISDLCDVFIERVPDAATVRFFYCDVNGKGSIGLNDLITLLGSIDTDSDGIPDINEPALGTDPLNPDSDADGLTDGAEVTTHFTNPLNPDTDGGGVNDGDEVTEGLNPLGPVDDVCLSEVGMVIENLGGNVSFRVSTNSTTGVEMPNLGDNIQYYDWSNCPNTDAISNLGDNVTYQVKDLIGV